MEEGLPKLRAALSRLEPFTVELHDFNFFNHGTGNVIYLEPRSYVSIIFFLLLNEPKPEGALRRLQTTLQDVYPFCDELALKSENGFTPHLTVGQASTVRKFRLRSL
jgi:poly(A) polymerase